MARAVPSVLMSTRSAWGVGVPVSVQLLLPGTGSVTPDGGATVAVLASVPVKLGLTKSVSWKLAVPPVASVPVVNVTVLEPGLYVAPFVAETNVVPAGRTSVTVAPVIVLGPLLVTVIV